MAAAASQRGCALVTGGSRGIGAAVATGLAADGWPVAINYRECEEAAEAVVAEIRSSGGRAIAIRADVADPGSPEAICAAIERELGQPVLVLVNNAATAARKLMLHLDEAAWQAVLETNLSAAYRLIRQVLRPMLRERFGRIVNIASVAATRPTVGQADYAASKAALVGLTRAVAVEVAARSVTVNAVAPGIVDTDSTADIDDALRSAAPAGRAGTPEEVAACVRFLASEQAGYVTGSVLTVDGGLAA